MLGRQQVSSSSIINDSENDLKYLALDKKEEQDICEYPDSDKVLSRSNNNGESILRNMSKSAESYEYFEDEE